MSEDQHSNARGWFKPLCCTMGIAMLAAIVAAWPVLDAAFYLVGLANFGPEMCVFGFLLILAAAIYLSMPFVRMVSRRSGLSDQKWRRRVLTAVTASTFLCSFVLVRSYSGDSYGTWARGIARYVEERADIEGIQKWLSTLDPNDCEDQPLEVKIAPGVKISHPPKYVPAPPAVGEFRHRANRLRRDDAGRPMIYFGLGGGGLRLRWGIIIGPKDMPIPPSSDISNNGVEIFPLAPGAYILLN